MENLLFFYSILFYPITLEGRRGTTDEFATTPFHLDLFSAALVVIFRCPKIWAHYSLIIMYLNIGTPNNPHFPFGTNGKVVVLGVPILKHFRVGKIGIIAKFHRTDLVI